MGDGSGSNYPGIAVFIQVFFVVYFLPSFIAWFRHLPNRWRIFSFNLLLGFTVIGWIQALIASLTRNPQDFE